MLLKLQFAEEFGTVEVGLGEGDGGPREEMGVGEGIATFVEVGMDVSTVKSGDVVLEEGLEGKDEGDLPWCVCGTFLETYAAQRTPTVDGVQHLLAGTHTACLLATGTEEDGANAVALQIVVDAIASGYAEELHAAVRPYVAIVLVEVGTDGCLLHAVVQEDVVASVGYSHLHLGTIGIGLLPVGMCDGGEGKSVTVEQGGNIASGGGSGFDEGNFHGF